MPPSADDPTTDYARKVSEGTIVAGPHVRDACARHLRDLDEGTQRGLTFSVAEAARAFAFYTEVLRLNGGEFEGVPFKLHPSQQFIIGSLFGWKGADGYRRFRVAFIEEGKGNGKALAVDTPIPTPDGWRTMGDLRKGDRVIDDRGDPCNVIGITPFMPRHTCYRLTFDDGSEIVADADHLWETSRHKHGKAIRTTEEIAKTLRRSNGSFPTANHRVALAGPLNLPEASLPIPPYTFGAWLGDGDSDCARLTMAFSDSQIAETIEAEGVSVDQRKRHSETVGRFLLGSYGRGKRRDESMQAKLRALNVLGAKHIPMLYLRASREQRTELLAGLLDTDGTISKSGQVELCLMSKRLIADAFELVASLGFKPTLSESDAVLNGRVVGRRYRLQFCPNRPAFRLDRKAARVRLDQWQALAGRRMIVGCEQIESVPVKCISVDSPRQMYLAGRSMIPTHNSPMVAGIGLMMLVADGEPRAEVYAAATKKDQAQILFRDAVAMVDQSPDLNRALERAGAAGREWNIADSATGSFFRCVASDDAQSGPRPHCALLDEVHEHKTGLMVEMMRAGTKGRRQALIVMITNSGSDKNSTCWSYHDYASKVASGSLIDDGFFSYVCALDEDDDPFKDEACWMKANPLLGISIKRKYIEDQVREARGMPSKEAYVRRLNFCQWTEAENPWISPRIWTAAADKYDDELLIGRRCFGGLDLSSTTDLTAFALFFEPVDSDPHWRLKVWFWLPQENLIEKAHENGDVDYPAWRAAGWLGTTPGAAVNKLFVLAKLVDCAAKYDIQAIGYDRWRIEDLRSRMQEEGAELPLVEHGQGFKDMAPAVDEFERMLISGEVRHDGNPVMNWNIGSAVIETDPAGNRKPTKSKSTGRIDGLVAAVMAAGQSLNAPKAEPEYQAFFTG